LIVSILVSAVSSASTSSLLSSDRLDEPEEMLTGSFSLSLRVYVRDVLLAVAAGFFDFKGAGADFLVAAGFLVFAFLRFSSSKADEEASWADEEVKSNSSFRWLRRFGSMARSVAVVKGLDFLVC